MKLFTTKKRFIELLFQLLIACNINKQIGNNHIQCSLWNVEIRRTAHLQVCRYRSSGPENGKQGVRGNKHVLRLSFTCYQ